MGLPQESRQSYKALVDSGNQRYYAFPSGAVGVAVVNATTGAWAWSTVDFTIIAAGAVAGYTDPSWLCGIVVLQSTWSAATIYGDIAIGYGAAAAETWVAEFPLLAGVPTAVGLATSGPIYLPHPIKIVGVPRIGARIRASTSAATGCTIKVIMASGVGS